MNNTQIEAEAGRQASFRELLDKMAGSLVEDGLVEAEAVTVWANWSDENLALQLIMVLIQVTMDQEDQLEIAAKAVKSVSRALKQIRELQAGDPEEQAGDDAHRILKELKEETKELTQLAKAA